MLTGEDIPGVIKQIIATNTSILVFSERNFMELTGVKQLYPQPWRQVHSIVIKRYTSNGDTYCNMAPAYNDLRRAKEKQRAKREKVPVTEEHHLEGASDEVKSAYLKIKEELIKSNGSLQFNPQAYYIALKKDRNVSFFHFRRSKIDLVVKYPEKETRKLIKKHEVRSLKESIQKFWGGTACSIILENSVHLQEIIGLLKNVLEKQ